MRSWFTYGISGVAALTVFTGSSQAINIVVDYRYDSNNFFNTQQKRDAMQAAADRFSAIITTSLGAVNFANDNTDQRIGFDNPGSGADWDVSPATGAGNDALVGAGASPAEEYRGPWSLAQDDWVLYAGGRSMTSAGIGGTGTGLNFTTVFSDPNSGLNRGFRASGSTSNLPVWGGAIAFDNDGDVTWHFDLDNPAPFGSTDFYSIALHEIGHVLGLSTGWDDWGDNQTGDVFQGASAVAAYNDANGSALTGLNVVDGTPPPGFAPNNHWEDGTYQAPIFAAGNPQLVGTIGLGGMQDLLMEPTANFTGTFRRFELTTVDVAALEDVGWTVISNTSAIPGDADCDGDVDLDDFNILAANFGQSVTVGKTVGDFDEDGDTDLDDFNILAANFGSGTENVGALPEPASLVLLLGGACASMLRRTR